MNLDTTPATAILLFILCAFFAILFLASLISKIHNFRKELDYLNREIGRTEGAERRYWQHEKRQLWLSLLPFYRR